MSDWARAIDTDLEGQADIAESGKELPLAEPAYTVRARSVVVLLGSIALFPLMYPITCETGDFGGIEITL